MLSIVPVAAAVAAAMGIFFSYAEPHEFNADAFIPTCVALRLDRRCEYRFCCRL